MLRLYSRAYRRTLSSINHPPPPSLNLQTILGQVGALATRGQLNEALTLFYTLQPPPSLIRCNQTYATLFHACARHNSLRQGLSLHHYMLAHNPTTPPDLFVSNHLINIYSKFGCLDHARHLFDEMPTRNLVTWTALISGFAQRGLADNCFRLFAAMLPHHLPNEFTFASVLSSCAAAETVRGRQVHALALKMSLDACTYVANALITMYCKGGVCDVSRDDDAWKVFTTMESRNLISWNSMIAGFQCLWMVWSLLKLLHISKRPSLGSDKLPRTRWQFSILSIV
ncbi:PREDICTED: pentatricopeptide repeat-containing protein At1g71420-like [Fragaria vesca subsp. vesca]|uniref:pentatricopeptide repeat-containing protein At1g71420 isoform X1 n=1 Tax=Fragaria vesca subsp. vesca TaxID=101020 RepID=UPI0002C36B8D|nr:PREDICTED: pentatricopeptide repeat-containing protein At1g71420 isoform X1 [Fragaria vesca subsp. vesca]